MHSHSERVGPDSGGGQGLRALLLLGALLLAVGMAGCHTDKPPTTDPGNNNDGVVVGAVGSFDHTKHLKLGLECDKCHAVNDEKDVIRPGSSDHEPCDGCHEEKFYEQPGEFCKVCHSEVDPTVEGATKVYPYPRPGRLSSAQLISRFNHKKHLERGRECENCHTVEADPNVPYATLPRHAACKKCHAETVQPSMDKCEGCHSQKGVPAPKRFLTNDIQFTHGKHFKDMEGQISCETCHAKIFESTSADDRGLPDMEICAKCHENPAKTRPQFRIKNCEVCHTGEIDPNNIPENHKKYTASLDPADAPVERPAPEVERLMKEIAVLAGADAREVVADISGLIPVARNTTAGDTKPDNHTALFRTNHAQAASLPDAKCGDCHAGLSGTPRDSCTDCHSTWKPRSHSLRWRGVEHGRAAARDPLPCTTCHMTEFCTECHNIPPPNHSPLNVFRFQHADTARFNARSCLTCHSFQATCTECHILDVIPFGLENQGLRRAR